MLGVRIEGGVFMCWVAEGSRAALGAVFESVGRFGLQEEMR